MVRPLNDLSELDNEPVYMPATSPQMDYLCDIIEREMLDNEEILDILSEIGIKTNSIDTLTVGEASKLLDELEERYGDK